MLWHLPWVPFSILEQFTSWEDSGFQREAVQQDGKRIGADKVRLGIFFLDPCPWLNRAPPVDFVLIMAALLGIDFILAGAMALSVTKENDVVLKETEAVAFCFLLASKSKELKWICMRSNETMISIN